jgi:hypothetical protein
MELKSKFSDPSFWVSESVPQTTKLPAMHLEHYFECRFAGPLISACTVGMTAKDDTMADTIVLLDRIINHPNNLSWVPIDLNTIKNSFFGASK